MSQHFHALAPELKRRIKEECLRETVVDSAELLGVPYPYIIPGKGKPAALYYWDSFFINLGLIRMRMIDQARHTVDNLVFLQRRLGFIPASNHRSMMAQSAPPMLAWMVRDVYRITGDKEWLRRVLPDVLHEFRFWTSKPHTTITGLYRYICEKPSSLSEEKASLLESGWMESPRFYDVRQFNPIDLNSLLYRNAKLIHDFQAEVDGKGDDRLIEKAEQIKKWLDVCWEEREGYYYDYDYVKKRISDVKTLAGMSPLFVEMVDERRARRLSQQLKHFMAPGGLYVMDRPEMPFAAPWNHPLCYAPSLYMTLKGLYDYDMMEDAADIGVNWLNMVVEQYEKTGELWEWYNAKDKSTVHDGLENKALLGWTAGVYIAIVELLGLD